MNRERAETFVRLVAEAELRQLTVDPRDRAPPPDALGAEGEAAGLLRRSAVAAMLRVLDDRQREAITLQYHAGLSEAETAAAMRISRGAVKAHTRNGISTLRAALETGYRTRRVARVLTAVGALDEQVAGQILGDFRLILAVRQAGSARQRMGRLLGLAAPRGQPTAWAAGQADPPGSAGPQASPGRVVPLGQLISFHGADVAGELYVLSYAPMASGPQLSVFARACDQSGLWELSGPRLFDPFTATDDRGTRYQVTIRDIGSGPLGWTLMLRPDPAHDPRWLDLIPIPGGPAVRIDLDRPAPEPYPPGAADVTVRKTTLGPAEYLLHTIAARLLAAASSGPLDASPVSGLTSGALTRLADGLGDIIAALQACGALSPLSPVPGQLAGLCAGLTVDGHGITAPPAGDLPEPWLSLLACHWRRNSRAAPARDGYAAATVMLPELDGIRLAILGLHNCQDSTVVHMHASGPRSEVIYGPGELYSWATLWVRDSDGRWHATRTLGRSGMNGEVALRVEVVPPLSRATAWIELLAAGQSAEVRATLQLHWESILPL
jgi:hypothetical protein